MSRTISPAAMKALEQQYMKETGIPGSLLMEHAAQGVCAAIARYVQHNRTVLFLCGPGNNGGDGYAAARLWQAQGGTSVILELTDQVSGDAFMNRTLANQHDVLFLPASQAETAFALCDAIVDALFGTGLNRAPEGLAKEWILRANSSAKPIISVDIPSGLDGASGHLAGEPENCIAIHAVETVTFHRIKEGLLLNQGPAYTGKMTVHPILIPGDWGNATGMRALMPQEASAMVPPRPFNAHKGTMGKVVIFAGSWGMAGAAAMCARAAIKTGAGLVHILCRQAILPILQTLCPGAVCEPLPEQNGASTAECQHAINRVLLGTDSAVVGCGLGRNRDLLPLLKLFREAKCPVVWDADALYLLGTHRDELLPLTDNAVITPHPGEAARLLNTNIATVTDDMLLSLKELQQLTHAHVLLKDARTLMTNGTDTAINPIGTPALSRGGSGDILSGILGALLAQRCRYAVDELSIVQLAALLHVQAAQRAEAQAGENNVTPELIIDSIIL